MIIRNHPGVFAFTCVVIALGTIGLVAGFWQSQSEGFLRLGCFLILATVLSGLTPALPVTPGSVGVGYIFILIGVTDYGMSETLVAGMLVSLAQTRQDFRMARQPLLQFFLVSSVIVAITSAYAIIQILGARVNALIPVIELLVAACTILTMTTFAPAALVALNKRTSIIQRWYGSLYWDLPYAVLGAAAATGISLVGRLYGWQIEILMMPAGYLAFVWLNGQIGELHGEQKASHYFQLTQTMGAGLVGTASLGSGNPARVQAYSDRLGKAHGFTRRELEALRSATLLRDIGSLAVPKLILSKEGKLTADEFEEVKKHPTVGAQILSNATFPDAVVEIVASHHERWDGNGYPKGLRGEEIPAGARILAIADCIGALTSERPHRQAVSVQEAMRYIVSESGRSFDPRLVSLLVRWHQEFERTVKLRPAAVCDGNIAFGDPFESLHSAIADGVPDYASAISQAVLEDLEIHRFATELGTSLSLQENLAFVASRLEQRINFECLVAYVRRNDLLHPEYAKGTEHLSFLSLNIPVGSGVSGWVAEHGEPLINNNPEADLVCGGDGLRTTSMKSALAVPIVGANSTLGALTLYSKTPNGFSEADRRFLSLVLGKLGVVVENALKFQNASDSALVDELTGLPNPRALFAHLEGEMERCKRSGAPLAILVCDLDGFKQVNDRFGHLSGNQVLQSVGEVLRDKCRGYDFVARMGGDEFVILLPGMRHARLAERVERLDQEVSKAASEVCPGCRVGFSIGFSHYPDDGERGEVLLAKADQRMYQAKQQRKSLGLITKNPGVRGFEFDSVSARIN